MPDKSAPNPKASEQLLNGIEQIRDIIFGEHIANWEKRFKKMEQSIQELSKTAESRINELTEKIGINLNETQTSSQSLKQEIDEKTNEIENSIKKLKSDFKKDIDNILENKVDKDSIGEVFIQWGQKVKAK